MHGQDSSYIIEMRDILDKQALISRPNKQINMFLSRIGLSLTAFANIYQYRSRSRICKMMLRKNQKLSASWKRRCLSSKCWQHHQTAVCLSRKIIAVCLFNCFVRASCFVGGAYDSWRFQNGQARSPNIRRKTDTIVLTRLRCAHKTFSTPIHGQFSSSSLSVKLINKNSK